MHKIAVMGDRDSIFGFASLGMHIFPVDDPADAAPMLHIFFQAEDGIRDISV